jgi:hypothetical protein
VFLVLAVCRGQSLWRFKAAGSEDKRWLQPNMTGDEAVDDLIVEKRLPGSHRNYFYPL